MSWRKRNALNALASAGAQFSSYAEEHDRKAKVLKDASLQGLADEVGRKAITNHKYAQLCFQAFDDLNSSRMERLGDAVKKFFHQLGEGLAHSPGPFYDL